MEEKVMTFEELVNYASDAREEYEKAVEERHHKKDESVRNIIKTIINNVKARGAVMITEFGDKETLYLNDSKIEESKNISVEALKKVIDRIPALYTDIDEEEKRLFVTFRRSETDGEK